MCLFYNYHNVIDIKVSLHNSSINCSIDRSDDTISDVFNSENLKRNNFICVNDLQRLHTYY